LKRVIRFSALGLAAAGLGALLLNISIEPGVAGKLVIPNNFPFPNASGLSATVSDQGEIDLDNPFFKSLGSNGRACVSCHEPDQGWGISAAGVKARFALTAGKHPIFRTNDGSNCNQNIDVSTLAGRRKAYTLLLERGLIRVAVEVPNGAEFVVEKVENEYGCTDTSTLSMYRRPLPATNLRFLTDVMWDGRESIEAITPTNPTALRFNLEDQAFGATRGHAEAIEDLTPEDQDKIVDFEMSLHTAQVYDYDAGWLNANGAKGGARLLAEQPFSVGTTDKNFSMFTSWSGVQGTGRVEAARASIARGEILFNTKGFNNPNAPTNPSTCSSCHTTANVGNHSTGNAYRDIGVADPANPLGVAYLPKITLRNKTTGATVVTTDPGRALITGKWSDMNKSKIPVLRGLASRAPYFRNGSAATLRDTVEFYDRKFQMGLTPQEKADLAAFLGTL
jgi:hypothetical protein